MKVNFSVLTFLGVGTNGKAVLEKLKKPAVALSAATANDDHLGTFGYMDVRDGDETK